MDPVPFVLAAVSLTASVVLASWAAGTRPAAALIGATVISVASATVDTATTALALLLLTTLIAVRFPWREPLVVEVVVGEDEPGELL